MLWRRAALLVEFRVSIDWKQPKPKIGHIARVETVGQINSRLTGLLVASSMGEIIRALPGPHSLFGAPDRHSGVGARCIGTRRRPCFWQSGRLAMATEPNLSC